MPEAVERENFLKTVAVDRLKRLNEVAAKYAAPWYRKLGLTAAGLAGTSEGWYRDY